MLNHSYIETEHILLALIHEGEGIAAKALESLNISFEAVRQQVEEIIGWGQAVPTAHIKWTPRAKKVIELSLRESVRLGHNHIGTEHILLGLVREGEGVAAHVLQKLGANLERVRRAVVQALPSPSLFEEREKIVLSLLIQEGMTGSAIGNVLGVSKETVGEIVQAVIEKLKDIK